MAVTARALRVVVFVVREPTPPELAMTAPHAGSAHRPIRADSQSSGGREGKREESKSYDFEFLGVSLSPCSFRSSPPPFFALTLPPSHPSPVRPPSSPCAPPSNNVGRAWPLPQSTPRRMTQAHRVCLLIRRQRPSTSPPLPSSNGVHAEDTCPRPSPPHHPCILQQLPAHPPPPRPPPPPPPQTPSTHTTTCRTQARHFAFPDVDNTDDAASPPGHHASQTAST
ncbi:hypothetical protein GALMADRAFT_149180 [Galerina marginata CBS 339.88]|uniref:Uncharacterized protein n=1 Tax=Galerina marginata (strain CBS 339.88) TaxID=685588 RepID=A0A067S4W0_GALM3|nr:hypothetical protein GALMADRAFT_149180 [Galerina marginata CBS 339.88]